MTKRKAKGRMGKNEMLDRPLVCKIKRGELVIRIGLNTLAFSAANHPDFWDGESDPEQRANIKVLDNKLWAEEVALEINNEAENGDTMLTLMLDKAMVRAIENGSCAVDYEHIEENKRRLDGEPKRRRK